MRVLSKCDAESSLVCEMCLFVKIMSKLGGLTIKISALDLQTVQVSLPLPACRLLYHAALQE